MFAAFLSLNVMSNSALAGVCDWRPSAIVGKGATGAAVAAGASGAAMKAAGFYTLVNAGSGLTMLGSTLAGASGASTIGIIAGTGGVIGTIGAFLLAPVTIVVGGITAVSVGGLEAACYFADERITDYEEVFAFMQHLALHHTEDRFQVVAGLPGREDDAIKIWNAETEELDRYMVADLAIVNGTLVHRKWGPNKNLGYIGYVPQQTAE